MCEAPASRIEYNRHSDLESVWLTFVLPITLLFSNSRSIPLLCHPSAGVALAHGQPPSSPSSSLAVVGSSLIFICVRATNYSLLLHSFSISKRRVPDIFGGDGDNIYEGHAPGHRAIQSWLDDDPGAFVLSPQDKGQDEEAAFSSSVGVVTLLK